MLAWRSIGAGCLRNGRHSRAYLGRWQSGVLGEEKKELLVRPSLPPSIRRSTRWRRRGFTSRKRSSATNERAKAKSSTEKEAERQSEAEPGNVVADKDREKAAEWGGDRVSFAEVDQVRNGRCKME